MDMISYNHQAIASHFSFMSFDQYLKYRMPREFPLTSSLLLDDHVRQHAHVHIARAGEITTDLDLFLKIAPIRH